jgi:protease I
VVPGAARARPLRPAGAGAALGPAHAGYAPSGASRKALEKAGATTEIVSLKPGRIQGFNHYDKADEFDVDRTVEEASADDYDANLQPGGVGNPDALRMDENAVRFFGEFFEQGKPAAVICHGPWMLVESGVVRGRTVTSWPSLRTDIHNAGGNWVDQEVCVDGNLVTSRKPDDLPGFNEKMLELFAKSPSGIHAEATPS